jgi:hypothetical protein
MSKAVPVKDTAFDMWQSPTQLNSACYSIASRSAKHKVRYPGIWDYFGEAIISAVKKLRALQAY